MRLQTWTTALALLLAWPAATAAAVPADLAAPGVLGRTVRPTSFTFTSLPKKLSPWTGPQQTVPEGVFEEAEQELEQLKERPAPPAIEDLGTVTLDRDRQRFTALAPVIETGFEGITQGGWIPSEPTVAAG